MGHRPPSRQSQPLGAVRVEGKELVMELPEDLEVGVLGQAVQVEREHLGRAMLAETGQVITLGLPLAVVAEALGLLVQILVQ